MTSREAEEYGHQALLSQGMTVVTMALAFAPASNALGVVACADRMLSSSSTSAHLPYSKITRLGRSWLIGYSGDPGLFIPFVRAIRAKDPDSLTTNQLATLAREEYIARRKVAIETQVLGGLGISLSDFYSTGLEKLGVARFNSLCDEISTHDLGISFIIGGWTNNNPYETALFAITNPGVHRDFTVIGSHAIGIGAPIALGHLYSTHNPVSTLESTLYRSMEAKIMAEAQRNVGPDSTLAMLTPDGKLQIVTDVDLDAFKRLWLKRREAIPTPLDQRLRSGLTEIATL